jgi:hypothetical protein
VNVPSVPRFPRFPNRGIEENSIECLRKEVVTLGVLMYDILLVLAKVLSDALTAASGVFGLLTEFKDDNKKITRSGRIALSGIILGFLLSGATTYIQVERSKSAELEHTQEIKRLSRPLGDKMGVWMLLSVRKTYSTRGDIDPYQPIFKG